MMLTGNSDQQTALEAVNEGQIFRFMNKPCPPEHLAKALEAGLTQYRLIVAERELLSNTLNGCVKMLTDVLSLANPTAFARASRVRDLARQMAQTLAGQDLWMIDLAAMLSQIGCVGVPDEVFARLQRGEELSVGEAKALATLPSIGRDLLKNIPRLEGVAEIIGCQAMRFDNQATDSNTRGSVTVPLGSRILKVALDFDALVSAGSTPDMALAEMQSRQGWYDPDVLATLRQIQEVTQTRFVREVKIHDLVEGMILAEDVVALNGAFLCRKGREITSAMCYRLANYADNVGVREPIKVFIPAEHFRWQ
jgi:response regulator RpfG family c-di-GMP phosphodiesterase